MKIVIAGAGSIGSVLGALLIRQGSDVHLLRRSPPFGTIILEVEGQADFRVEATVVERVTNTPDLVIITIQEQQMKEFVQQLVEVIPLGSETILLTLQNGITAPEILLEKFPRKRVLAGAVWWSAALIAHNQVLYHRSADTVIGIPDGSEAQPSDLDQVASLLSTVLAVSTTDNIIQELRSKLILNVVSPVLALVKRPYPQGLSNDHTRALVHALFDEALETAALFGWNIDEQDPRLLNFHIRLAEGGFDPDLPSVSRHKVSTQLGMEKYGGRLSNVDELLGWLQLSGSLLADQVIQLIHSKPPDYEPVSSSVLDSLLQTSNSARCRL